MKEDSLVKLQDKQKTASASAEQEEGFDPLSLIDDHEEEFSVDGRTVRRRGIYFLPNLFTTAALFAGFYAIVSSMSGKFEVAAIAIFIAMVLDGLDGRVARLTNTQSKFGAEYDSLSDMVSFGVAPALIIYQWALLPLGKVGMTAAFIYVACAALRLAKFNTQIDTADKNFFSGLASPAAASVVAGMLWVCVDQGWVGSEVSIQLSILAALVTALAGALMILNVPYHSFKGFDLKRRVPFVVMILVVFLFGVVMVDPSGFLLGAALIYALSGPIVAVYQKLRGKSLSDSA